MCDGSSRIKELQRRVVDVTRSSMDIPSSAVIVTRSSSNIPSSANRSGSCGLQYRRLPRLSIEVA